MRKWFTYSTTLRHNIFIMNLEQGVSFGDSPYYMQAAQKCKNICVRTVWLDIKYQTQNPPYTQKLPVDSGVGGRDYCMEGAETGQIEFEHEYMLKHEQAEAMMDSQIMQVKNTTKELDNENKSLKKHRHLVTE